ncbi:hypothetical protein DL765_004946 [Monosporascus sp. GIB2]|nr:hypothetical protein DL765_004946 [Monosporascus sp. GIB2]
MARPVRNTRGLLARPLLLRGPRQQNVPIWGKAALRSSTRTRPRECVANDEGGSTWREPMSKLLEGAATALGSIVILGLAGYSYHRYYKSLVLVKIENSFLPGYFNFERAALGPVGAESAVEDEDWIPRSEQAIIDKIVAGSAQGHYYLVTGEKGTGKTSMILKAMTKVNGDGVAMLEAHGDLEIFRIRLGKALDYEFHEDYIGSLFSFKGPRDTTPLLDIERAFNQMEKIALKRQKEIGRPLVLIIHGTHLLRDDENGRHLLELLQQRAELWATSKLVTVVLNSDEHWLTERLMRHATRLQVIPVRDIGKDTAIASVKKFRAKTFHEDVPDQLLEQVYSRIGGRLRFLSHVAKSPDMLKTCDAICERERHWLLDQCWILGAEMDPGAEEQQDIAASAMIMAKALIAKEKVMMKDKHYDGRLPQIPLHEARELVTNKDFLKALDNLNIVTIDSHSMVQADSVAMQNAFRAVCSQPGFDEHLRATMDRLDELESLARTRELTIKDLWGNKGFRAVVESSKGGHEEMVISIRGFSSKPKDG